MKIRTFILIIFVVIPIIITVSYFYESTSKESIDAKNDSLVTTKTQKKKGYIDDGYKDEVLFSGFHTNVLSTQASRRLDSLTKQSNSNFKEIVYHKQKLGSNESYEVCDLVYIMTFDNGKSIFFEIDLNNFNSYTDNVYVGASMEKLLGRYLNSIVLINESYENDKIDDILKLYKKKYGVFLQKRKIGLERSGLDALADLKPSIKYELIKYTFPSNKNLLITFKKQFPTKYDSKSNYIICITYVSTRLIDKLNQADKSLKLKEKKTTKKVMDDI